MDLVEVVQTRPASNGLAVAVRKPPAQRAGQTKSALIGCAAADTHQATFGSLCRSRLQHRRQTKRIQLEWMKVFRRQERQTDDLGRFDDGRPGFGFPPPLGLARAMGRINCSDGLNLGAEQFADNFAKAIAAVAHRQQSQRVLWSGSAPAASNGLSGLTGTECALELIGNNQDIQQHR